LGCPISSLKRLALQGSSALLSAAKRTEEEKMVNKLSFLLLSPVLALAQPPAANIDPQAIYEQSKAAMLPMMEQSLPGMNAVRDCLQGAEDKAAFEKCTALMAELDNKLRNMAGQVTGIPTDKMPQTKDPKEIEWSPETKQNMLKYLDRTIAMGTIMSGCFKQSASMQEMQQCMQANKPKP
jgi:hypothetical protein